MNGYNNFLFEGVAKPEDRPTSGVLSSPNYPQRYLRHALSTNVIEVAKGQNIKIRVTYLDVGFYDILKIDDAKGGKCAHRLRVGRQGGDWGRSIVHGTRIPTAPNTSANTMIL